MCFECNPRTVLRYLWSFGRQLGHTAAPHPTLDPTRFGTCHLRQVGTTGGGPSTRATVTGSAPSRLDYDFESGSFSVEGERESRLEPSVLPSPST